MASAGRPCTSPPWASKSSMSLIEMTAFMVRRNWLRLRGGKERRELTSAGPGKHSPQPASERVGKVVETIPRGASTFVRHWLQILQPNNVQRRSDDRFRGKTRLLVD